VLLLDLLRTNTSVRAIDKKRKKRALMIVIASQEEKE
jgi:hypothetical protein